MVAWTKDNRKKPKGSKCLAKKSDGTLCQNWAMPNGRCKFHGGKAVPAPKGSKRALKHGLYAKGFIGDELSIFPDIPLGSIDDEIRLLKIKLRRAWVAQRMWLEKHKEIQQEVTDKEEGIQTVGFIQKPKKRRLTRTLKRNLTPIEDHYRLESIETSVELVHDKEGIPHTNRKVKSVKKKEDYSHEINRLTRLISNLESIRSKDLIGKGEDQKGLVEQFRDYADMAAETLHRHGA